MNHEINYNELAREFAGIQTAKGYDFRLNLGQMIKLAKFTCEIRSRRDGQVVYEKLFEAVKELSDSGYDPRVHPTYLIRE